jgi:hypothetical protein
MDPMAVIRAMWLHKVFVLPVLLLTAVAAGYVFQFGPRYYEAGTSYAIVNPRLPSDRELLQDASLANLNRDNPFLRSSDQALISEVLIARLTTTAVAEGLQAKGLSTDYTVNKGINGNGFVVSITGSADSDDLAIKTVTALGNELESNLRDVQKVNNADDRFLFTALTVTPLGKATEQFSSRLRSVVMVVLGGAVLMFTAVSMARSAGSMRRNQHRKKKQPTLGGDAPKTPNEDNERGASGERHYVVPSTKEPGVLPAATPAKRPPGPKLSTRRSNRMPSSAESGDEIRSGERVMR